MVKVWTGLQTVTRCQVPRPLGLLMGKHFIVTRRPTQLTQYYSCGWAGRSVWGFVMLCTVSRDTALTEVSVTSLHNSVLYFVALQLWTIVRNILWNHSALLVMVCLVTNHNTILSVLAAKSKISMCSMSSISMSSMSMSNAILNSFG